MWTSVMKPFSNKTHKDFHDDLRSYRAGGRRLYGARPYRRDRHGHIIHLFEVDLPTIVEEKPKKAKKKSPSIKPPLELWDQG